MLAPTAIEPLQDTLDAPLPTPPGTETLLRMPLSANDKQAVMEIATSAPAETAPPIQGNLSPVPSDRPDMATKIWVGTAVLTSIGLGLFTLLR